jgi:hypothetical protein
LFVEFDRCDVEKPCPVWLVADAIVEGCDCVLAAQEQVDRLIVPVLDQCVDPASAGAYFGGREATNSPNGPGVDATDTGTIPPPRARASAVVQVREVMRVTTKKVANAIKM